MIHTFVSYPHSVCNRIPVNGAYARLHLCKSKSVETLAERMTWLVESLNTTPTALSEKAGLSKAHIRNIAKGIRKNITTETLSAIAVATGCSARWLANGDGEAFTSATGADSAETVRYPTLWRVLATFPERWGGDVVQAAKSVKLDFDGDPDFETWVRLLDRFKAAHEIAIREVLKPKGDPLVGLAKPSRF